MKASQLPQQGLMLAVRAYRLLLKPWLGNACRFEPTCSAYALVALERHGACRGTALSGWRLLRCHPWCHGGHDPVPAHFGFRRVPSAPDLPSTNSSTPAGTEPSRTRS